MIEQTYHTEEIQNGYEVRKFSFPTKRYCQTLDLKNDQTLIDEYKKRHSKKHYWPEVGEGIRKVGILNMEIYIYETNLFMIIETRLDFDWDEAFKVLETLPRQSEWEEYMSIFQNVLESHKRTNPAEKWKLMERIFELP